MNKFLILAAVLVLMTICHESFGQKKGGDILFLDVAPLRLDIEASINKEDNNVCNNKPLCEDGSKQNYNPATKKCECRGRGITIDISLWNNPKNK